MEACTSPIDARTCFYWFSMLSGGFEGLGWWREALTLLINARTSIFMDFNEFSLYFHAIRACGGQEFGQPVASSFRCVLPLQDDAIKRAALCNIYVDCKKFWQPVSSNSRFVLPL